jgi:glycosyltransferase involved in cell wall biosynthesis
MSTSETPSTYPADVTLILEGTYPYVTGGVSSWVHQMISSFPNRSFALMHIGPYPGAYTQRAFELPGNVTTVEDVYCRGATTAPGHKRPPLERPSVTKGAASRMLRGFRRLHISDDVDTELIADLASCDLSIPEFLHGEATFSLMKEIYARTSPGAPFTDFFWHFRAMHLPLMRLLKAPCPKAAAYHTVSTGYAGLVGAVASYRDGRPLIVTEHGLYSRERELELSRTTWIRDAGPEQGGDSVPSPLRKLWARYFRMLSRIAYHQADKLLTLSAANRSKQLADGADASKITVVPNGVEPRAKPSEVRTPPAPAGQPMRVGFVGRVVPIKDIVTLIRASQLALQEVDLEVWIVGPESEDPAYAERCRALVKVLGLEEQFKFMGSQPMAAIYPQLDVVVLTSLSEGQPLVILEAYAAGLPVIATDVGACRELIEGAGEADCKLGPSGYVTRVASPADTAAALVKMARRPAQRIAMGRAGWARLAARYQLGQVVAAYESIYQTATDSVSIGHGPVSS